MLRRTFCSCLNPHGMCSFACRGVYFAIKSATSTSADFIELFSVSAEVALHTKNNIYLRFVTIQTKKKKYSRPPSLQTDKLGPAIFIRFLRN